VQKHTWGPSVDEANDLLRYGIKTLKGDAFDARPGTLLAHAITIKQYLQRWGYWWQGEKLDIWIARAKRGDFTPAQQVASPKVGRDSS